MTASLPTQPEDFPGSRPPPSVPRAPKKVRSLTGQLIVIPIMVLVIAMVLSLWALIWPDADVHRDDPGLIIFGLVSYGLVAAVVGAVLGTIVGLVSVVANVVAFQLRNTVVARLVGVGVVAGSSTALLLQALFLYGGITSLAWLHVLLTIAIPTLLCWSISRWARLSASQQQWTQQAAQQAQDPRTGKA